MNKVYNCLFQSLPLKKTTSQQTTMIKSSIKKVYSVKGANMLMVSRNANYDIDTVISSDATTLKKNSYLVKMRTIFSVLIKL